MSLDRKLYITHNWIIGLFVYYLFLFILGILASIGVMANMIFADASIFVQALAGSISISLTASATSYIRKLYKLCFSYSSDEDQVDQLFLKRLGTIVYFVARPFFGVAFSLLVVASLKSAFLVSATADAVLEEGFIYICMVTSFYVGFLSGDFIKRMEKNGQEKFSGIT